MMEIIYVVLKVLFVSLLFILSVEITLNRKKIKKYVKKRLKKVYNVYKKYLK